MTLKIKCFFIVIFMSFHAYVHADDNINLKLRGTIGNYPIAMNLIIYDESASTSTYFYEKVGKDIVLDGVLSDDKLTLTSTIDEAEETFELYFENKKTLKGTWKKDGQELPVKLVEFQPSSINLNAEKKMMLEYFSTKNYQINDLDLIKFSRMEFKRDSVTRYKNREFVWFTEKYSGIQHFRIGNGFSESSRSLVNTGLDYAHYLEAFSVLSCSSPHGNAMYENDIDITYLDENLMGYEMYTYWSCGGSYSDYSHTGFLIDLNSGYEYTIEDILKFGDLHTQYDEVNTDRWFKYREQQVAPALIRLISEFKGSVDVDEDCDFFSAQHWNFFNWVYTEKGIEFTPQYAKVATICRVPIEIPFRHLKQYKNPLFTHEFKSQ